MGSRKADLSTYDRATSATRLQSCSHRRWTTDVTSRMHICTHLYTLQPKKIPNCNRVRTETLWFQNVRFGSKTYDLAPKQTFLAPKKQQQRRHTRARFCRLGPLDRTRLRCRTTVPQLVFCTFRVILKCSAWNPPGPGAVPGAILRIAVAI